MPRPKKYNEAEVADKAMNTFWKYGYSNTSARLLEREMGINLFSIYSSFKNKDGLFLESLRTYKQMNREKLLKPLKNGTSVQDIRTYFINFLKFTKENNSYKGCLLINSAHELGSNMPAAVNTEISTFASEILVALRSILSQSYESKKAEKLANYFFGSLTGLITSARSLSQKQIDDYLEVTFSKD